MTNKQVDKIYKEVKKINSFANFRSKVDTGYPFINIFIDNRDVETSLKMFTILKEKYGFEGVVRDTEIMGGIRKEMI